MRLPYKSKDTDEWGTPQYLYDLLDDEFSFELDAAASDKNHKHENYLTKAVDALNLDTAWRFCNFNNPPYSKLLPWYERWVYEREKFGAITVGPVKYDPSTKHGVFAAEEMDEIRIVEHRVKYEGATTGANFPTAIMVCRPRLYTRKTGARILYVNYREIEK